MSDKKKDSTLWLPPRSSRETTAGMPGGGDFSERLRLLQLQEEIAQMERERLESHLMQEDIAEQIDHETRSALNHHLKTRHAYMELLRDGRILEPEEVPAEVMLDISEIVFWRHSLAEATGLQTLLYLKDGDHWRPAANHSGQLPCLRDCDTACIAAVDDHIYRHFREDGGMARCPVCRKPLWISPIELVHDRKRAMLGCLVGHALLEPVEPMQRMVDMVAGMAARRASETYARQVSTILEMQVTALIRKYTEQKIRSAERSREAMLQQARTSSDLAVAKDSLEHALYLAQKATADAERANRSKSMFLASMSHEIRTPLTCIIGFADLLTMSGLGEKEMREFAVSVQQSGQVLLSIINNVLDLSKIEAGRLELEHVPYSLKGILSEVRDIFANSAEDKGLDLVLDMADNLPAQQVGDPTRLRQVAMNLVGNAVKFTSSGSIVVSCGLCDADPETLELRVVDTGPGISRKGLSRIFDAFIQADAGTTRRHGGSGLGLAISQQIVKAMGGRLEAKSEVGLGTSFICRFRNELEKKADSEVLQPN